MRVLSSSLLAALVLPFAVSCMSGGPGSTSSTGDPSANANGAAGRTATPAEGDANENEQPATDETTTVVPDGIAFTIEGKTYRFIAQQQALPLASYVFLRTSESDAEYPWVGLRAYATEKGSYPCVDGGTVVWYAKSKTETYTSTSCVINIRKLGAIGEIVEGDFSGELARDYVSGSGPDESEDPGATTVPASIAITRATFHMTARSSE